MYLVCTPYVRKIRSTRIFPNSRFPSEFSTKILCSSPFPPHILTFPTHLSLLALWLCLCPNRLSIKTHAILLNCTHVEFRSIFYCQFLMVFIVLSFRSFFTSLPYSRTIFIRAMCWISGLIFVLFVTVMLLVTYIPGAGNKVIWTQNKHVRQSVTQWADVPFRFSHETGLLYVLLL